MGKSNCFCNVFEETDDLHFKDGPFWVDAEKRDDAVTHHFNTDRRGIPVIPNVQIPFRDLAEAVERAMRS